jgi:protein-tyrosine phosphatase
MIDFHTHILPAIDDGAENIAESLALLKDLENQGVTKVVLSPHYYGRTKNVAKFLQGRESAYLKLSVEYASTIQLFKGCECNISTCANNDFSDFCELSIGGTRYILTEMSFEKEWDKTLIKRLINLTDTGLTPIIAHTELYPAVQKNPELVCELIKMGCAIQINCDSVLSDENYPLVYAMLAHGQVHALGSDTHNTTKRPPKYQRAVQRIENDFGADMAESLQRSMQNMLDDKHINFLSGTPIKKKFLCGYK